MWEVRGGITNGPWGTFPHVPQHTLMPPGGSGDLCIGYSTVDWLLVYKAQIGAVWTVEGHHWTIVYRVHPAKLTTTGDFPWL